MSTAAHAQKVLPGIPVWAIVENAGTDQQEILKTWGQGCMGEAMRSLGYFRQNSHGVDLMKFGPDGQLTTEF